MMNSEIPAKPRRKVYGPIPADSALCHSWVKKDLYAPEVWIIANNLGVFPPISRSGLALVRQKKTPKKGYLLSNECF